MSEGELNINTSFDPNLSRNLDRTIKQAFRHSLKVADTQIAYIAIDPRSGQVRALAGSVDYRQNQFDRSHRLRRPAAGMLLPFLYQYAIESGQDLHKPLPRSTMSLVELMAMPENKQLELLSYAYGLGTLNRHLEGLGLGTGFERLGARVDLSPLSVAKAYGFLATGGTVCLPMFITGLKRGRSQIYTEPSRCVNSNAESSSYMVSFLLEARIKGIDSARISPKPYFFSEDASGHNLWFVAYSQELVISVWLGSELGLQRLDFGSRSLSATLIDLHERLSALAHFGRRSSALKPPSQLGFRLQAVGQQKIGLPFMKGRVQRRQF